jgi:spermidine/putrescine transport system permease protein
MSAPRSRRPYLLAAPAWVLLGVFVVVPLLLMLYVSLHQKSVYGGSRPVEDWWTHLITGQAFANYRRSLAGLYWPIYWRSLWMAVLTTLICLVISYPVAYYLAVLAPRRRRTLLLTLAVVPFWTSFLIRTYAWMLILRTQGLVNTVLMEAGLVNAPLDLLYNEFAVMLGLVYGELPFMILPLYASLEKLDLTLLEAANDLGASPVSAFWRVTVPLTLPGIAAGIVLVFIPSLGQFVVSDLLGGAKSMLVGNLIQNQFLTANNRPFGSAVAFELTAVVLLLLLAYGWYAKRRGQETVL